MAIATEIQRLQTAANIIKAKTEELGLKKDSKDGTGLISSDDTLDVQARALDLINKVDIDSTITSPDGEISLPEGYYNGTGKVKANVDVKYYITGSSVPDTFVGNEGDIYLVI